MESVFVAFLTHFDSMLQKFQDRANAYQADVHRGGETTRCLQTVGMIKPSDASKTSGYSMLLNSSEGLTE